MIPPTTDFQPETAEEDFQIGDNIRKLREIIGYKQEYVAEQVGLSTNHYGDIERGKADPKWSQLQKIAKALNINVRKLIAFDSQQIIVNISNNTFSENATTGYYAVTNTHPLAARERQLYEKLIASLEARLEASGK